MLLISALFVCSATFLICSYSIILNIIEYNSIWNSYYDIYQNQPLESVLNPFLRPIFEPIFENDQQKIIEILEKRIKILEERIKVVEESNKILIKDNLLLEKKNSVKYENNSSSVNGADIVIKFFILIFYSECVKRVIQIMREQ